MEGWKSALLCDYYEFTMANGYIREGLADRIVYFDMFYRQVPDGGGFAVAAGLEQLVERILGLRFTEDDLAYLRSKGTFCEEFLDYLAGFRFTGDLYAVPEGTPVFPGEPIITVRAAAPQAQLIETLLLLTINHQTLIATKADRIVRAAEGRTVMEFGTRRAHGADAAVLGARAAYIAGCGGTACALADRLHGIPASGTMAHSWVQMFGSELDAFRSFCRLYPRDATLLVDTYDTLESGVPNAIRAFREELLPLGIDDCAIRLDSGDIAFLTRRARAMLDEAGLTGCRIIASNSLDEWLIRDLVDQGARIDAFGVGEKLITARSDPVFGGVYKLVAVEDDDGTVVPKIKISENVGKITTPHFKKVYRLFDEEGMAIADQICIHDETIDETRPLEIFDPEATWKRKTLTDFTAEELLVPVIIGGRLVADLPPLEQVRRYREEQAGTLWDEVKRFSNPHRYYVDLSERLWQVKQDLLRRD